MNIRGMRFHFAGSADVRASQKNLTYCHSLVKQLVKHVLSQEGGIVAGLASEPHHSKDKSLSTTFDWTVLEATNEALKTLPKTWPSSKGPRIAVVGLPNWDSKIPAHRQRLWGELRDSGRVGLVQVNSAFRFGGMLRQTQQKYGDVLVVIGGKLGAEHLAELYTSNGKPVVPIDVRLGEPKGEALASEKLARIALENPERCIAYSIPEKAAASFSGLSLRGGLPDQAEYERRFFGFISGLKGPRAFYVRLQKKDARDFPAVEHYFRRVVDPIVKDMGYEPFEIGRNTTREGFMNSEIFQNISTSSIVIVDLTGHRPNCYIEGGFAFGLGKSVIMTARKNTKPPFDISAVPYHRWSSKDSDQKARIALQKFIRRNSQRRLLRSDTLIRV